MYTSYGTREACTPAMVPGRLCCIYIHHLPHPAGSTRLVVPVPPIPGR